MQPSHSSDSSRIWNELLPFPNPEQIPLLDTVTHVMVERAVQGEYHYLHEPAVAWHRGVLHIGWANGPLRESNTCDEIYRGRCSRDGGHTWGDIEIVGPCDNLVAHNHGVYLSTGGELWAFIARWDNVRRETDMWDLAAIRAGLVTECMEAFTRDEATGRWLSRGLPVKDFIPFDRPKQLANGRWIIAGETAFIGQPAVILSEGSDLLRWRRVAIPLPTGLVLKFPETSLLLEGNRLTAIIRDQPLETPSSDWPTGVALTAHSEDSGETWSEVQPSNLPMARSKGFADNLSTGQRVVISNTPPGGRNMLTIAVSRPGELHLSRIWRIQQGASPARFLKNPQWAYPAAVEHEGALYVTYCVSKEDCALSIIPLGALAVRK
jgi:hypothetical protein